MNTKELLKELKRLKIEHDPKASKKELQKVYDDNTEDEEEEDEEESAENEGEDVKDEDDGEEKEEEEDESPKGSKDVAVVSWKGRTREYSKELHGKDFRKLAKQFADQPEIQGKVS